MFADPHRLRVFWILAIYDRQELAQAAERSRRAAISAELAKTGVNTRMAAVDHALRSYEFQKRFVAHAEERAAAKNEEHLRDIALVVLRDEMGIDVDGVLLKLRRKLPKETIRQGLPVGAAQLSFSVGAAVELAQAAIAAVDGPANVEANDRAA